MTATFFNAKFIKKMLVKGTRLMLSGEVGYFKGTMQLTHPAFLVLEGRGQGKGSKSLAKIAETSQKPRRRLAALGVRAGLLPDLPAPTPRCRAGTSTRVCARCSTCSIPFDDPLPEPFCGNGI